MIDPQRNILLVHPEDPRREALRSRLESMGYKCRVAGSAMEALDLVEPLPTLLLAEWELPRMNGLELIRELRRHHPSLTAALVSDRSEANEAADLDGIRVVGHAPTVEQLASLRARALVGKKPPSRPTVVVAVATLALVAGLATLGLPLLSPPPLPEPGDQNLRGEDLEVLEPIGDLSEAPSLFRWEPDPDAAQYFLQVRGVDQSPLWSARSLQASAEPPDSFRSTLRVGSTFYWRIEALDASNDIIARSSWTRFAIAPPSEEIKP